MCYTESNADTNNIGMDFKRKGEHEETMSWVFARQDKDKPSLSWKDMCSFGKFYKAGNFLGFSCGPEKPTGYKS